MITERRAQRPEGCGAVASGGFEVTPSELDDAATAYRQQGEAIQKAVDVLTSATDMPDSVFGRLPASGEFASGSRELRSQIVQDSTKLYQGLLDGATKLSATAAIYRAADQAATVREA